MLAVLVAVVVSVAALAVAGLTVFVTDEMVEQNYTAAFQAAHNRVSAKLDAVKAEVAKVEAELAATEAFVAARIQPVVNRLKALL